MIDVDAAEKAAHEFCDEEACFPSIQPPCDGRIHAAIRALRSAAFEAGKLEHAEMCARSGAEIPCRFCLAWAKQYRLNAAHEHTHFGEPCRAPEDCPDGGRSLAAKEDSDD